MIIHDWNWQRAKVLPLIAVIQIKHFIISLFSFYQLMARSINFYFLAHQNWVHVRNWVQNSVLSACNKCMKCLEDAFKLLWNLNIYLSFWFNASSASARIKTRTLCIVMVQLSKVGGVEVCTKIKPKWKICGIFLLLLLLSNYSNAQNVFSMVFIRLHSTEKTNAFELQIQRMLAHSV